MAKQFEHWMDDLRTIAVKEFGYTFESAKSMDESAFLDYWEEGLSPNDAMTEDATP